MDYELALYFPGDKKGIHCQNDECISKFQDAEVTMQYKQAFLDAKEQFGQQDPSRMAEMAGGIWKNDGFIELPYLGKPLYIHHPDGAIQSEGWPELPHEELIIIYQYLTGASGLPLRDRWLSFLELPGGPHHFAPFQIEAIFPLAKAFGRRPADFLAAAQTLGGQKGEMAQASSMIEVFPRLPLAFLLWLEDDEFPASANILFDASAQTHLPTASLYMLGIAVAKRLLKTVVG
jgi:hypothetical protein